jgi:phosphomannomutase
MIGEKLLKAEGFSSVRSYDVVKVNYEDGGWILTYPSGTEDEIRVYSEETTLERLNGLVEGVSRIVKKALEIT